MKYVVLPQAENDIEEIWFYLVQRNPVAADKTVHMLTESFENLTLFPEMGRARLDLQSGIRAIVKSPYVVFYTVDSSVIEIVRVLHGSRDIEAMFN